MVVPARLPMYIGRILDTEGINAPHRPRCQPGKPHRPQPLKARAKPHYRSLEPGTLHLGYRKPLSGAGKWLARHYVGDQRY